MIGLQVDHMSTYLGLMVAVLNELLRQHCDVLRLEFATAAPEWCEAYLGELHS